MCTLGIVSSLTTAPRLSPGAHLLQEGIQSRLRMLRKSSPDLFASYMNQRPETFKIGRIQLNHTLILRGQ